MSCKELKNLVGMSNFVTTFFSWIMTYSCHGNVSIHLTVMRSKADILPWDNKFEDWDVSRFLNLPVTMGYPLPSINHYRHL